MTHKNKQPDRRSDAARLLVVSSSARLRRLVGTLACIALLLAPATFAADESAGQFAIRVKTAELRGKWGAVWDSMYPGQKAFISRALFIQCKSKSKVQSSPARAVRVVSVSTSLAAIPGVPGSKVRMSTVKVSIDYGKAAPSQTTAIRQARVGKAWYAISDASSRRMFIRTNFCS